MVFIVGLIKSYGTSTRLLNCQILDGGGTFPQPLPVAIRMKTFQSGKKYSHSGKVSSMSELAFFCPNYWGKPEKKGHEPEKKVFALELARILFFCKVTPILDVGMHSPAFPLQFKFCFYFSCLRGL